MTVQFISAEQDETVKIDLPDWIVVITQDEKGPLRLCVRAHDGSPAVETHRVIGTRESPAFSATFNSRTGKDKQDV